MIRKMYFIAAFLMVLFNFGCGDNAHITDALIATPIDDGGVVVEEPAPSLPPVVPYEVRAYIGSASDGINGYMTTSFAADLSGVGVQTLEDFDAMTDGATLLITGTRGGIGYNLIHTDDDGGLGLGSRNVYIEDPASQDGASSGTRGLDLRFGSGTTLNMLSVSFDTAVAHVGVDLIDFESSSAFTLGKLKTYDCTLPTPNVLNTTNIDFGVEDGNAEIHFVGLTSTEVEICHFTVSVGDDGVGGGTSERFAVDNIRFGTAVLEP